MAAFSEFTPAELREKSRLTIAAARNEPNLLLKQAMAGLAFDIAMHAEDIERRAAHASQPAGHNGTPRRPTEQLSQRVWAEKQITERTTQQVGDAPPRQMMRAVVDQMASLTEAAQVARTVIAGIMIKMRRSKHHPSLPNASCFDGVGPTR